MMQTEEDLPVTTMGFGLPMIFVVAYVLLPGLLPMVAGKTLVMRRLLRRDGWELLPGVFGATSLSTLIGVPITWSAVLFFQIAGEQIGLPGHLGFWAQFAWLPDLEFGQDGWMIRVAATCLCLPFFLISSLIEWVVLVRIYPSIERRRLMRASIRANAAAYGFIALFWALLLAAEQA